MKIRNNFSGFAAKRALLGCTLLTSMFASGAVLAQDEGATVETEDRIVVTGSRIVRPNLDSPNPVSTVDSADVTLSGDVNVVDIVNDIPALIGSTNTQQNAVGIGTLGAATLDLRNLGTERTLVLVDGRRHVSGVAGTATVDVNTIPAALVERVEVLTGGASAIYGADAVTGVVNFIMKDDFEGFSGRAQYSTSDDWDADIYYISGTAGKNFAGDRGNATLSFAYEKNEELRQGDRRHTRGDRNATDWPNPLRRVQASDISQFGLDPLLLGQSISSFCGAGDMTLGAGQSELCGRIDGIPDRTILPFPRFAVSNYGSIIGVDFFGDGFLSYYPGDPFTDIFGSDLSGIDLGADGLVFDLDNDGIEDCLQTANGTLAQRFGGFAGCHVVDAPGGEARPFLDGLIADSINQFGGDGTFTGLDGAIIVPDERRYTVNATTRYDFTPNLTWFGEFKYSNSKVVTGGPSVNGFFDSIPVPIDNPFIPANIRTSIEEFVADNPGFFDLDDVLLFVGRDMTDLGPQLTESKRKTLRFVSGVEGELENGISYEFSVNYGRTDADTFSTNNLVMDRFYAAVDAVDDGSGNIVCRSTLDPNAVPGTGFLPSQAVPIGFNTFTPGAGSPCVPIDLFGVGAPSQAAIDFVTVPLMRERTLKQFVVSGFFTGDTEKWINLPGGPVFYAAGAEYRKEESSFKVEDFEKAQCNPGELFIAGVTDPMTCSIPFLNGNPQQLVFDPRLPIDDVSGSFNVWEVFGEVSLPILSEQPFIDELTIDAAVRYGNYSTVGGTTTWKAGGVWAPVQDLKFRGTYSLTIRAPNINELFSPLLADTARPIDPCDAAELGNGTEFRAANCAADGIPPTFTDPLTARISGFTGGNPDLSEESAKTYTAGFILQPRFMPGLSITADYYNIRIEDAIETVGVQEIVNACYDLSTFPNQFCEQFQRDRNMASPQFLGLSSFTRTELNFAALETEGIDYEVAYRFSFGSISSALDGLGDGLVRVVGNYARRLDRFEDPVDETNVNPEIYENGQPKHAFNIDGRWMWNGLTLNWQSRFYGNILELTPRLQIENVDSFENAWAGRTWRHDLSGTYDINENVRVYGGVNNITDTQPILSSVSYPVGIIGRQFFLGVDVNF